MSTMYYCARCDTMTAITVRCSSKTPTTRGEWFDIRCGRCDLVLATTTTDVVREGQRLEQLSAQCASLRRDAELGANVRRLAHVVTFDNLLSVQTETGFDGEGPKYRITGKYIPKPAEYHSTLDEAVHVAVQRAALDTKEGGHE